MRRIATERLHSFTAMHMNILHRSRTAVATGVFAVTTSQDARRPAVPE
ncbi:hypothetical protein RHECNPAF_6420084 [Rhizobium etli CNPAF512]|nr:hypothetical protein RHECNPAF_6420084 [Rhizobium etli CNPAF512]